MSVDFVNMLLIWKNVFVALSAGHTYQVLSNLLI